jgi:hypothetical protein
LCTLPNGHSPAHSGQRPSALGPVWAAAPQRHGTTSSPRQRCSPEHVKAMVGDIFREPTFSFVVFPAILSPSRVSRRQRTRDRTTRAPLPSRVAEIFWGATALPRAYKRHQRARCGRRGGGRPRAGGHVEEARSSEPPTPRPAREHRAPASVAPESLPPDARASRSPQPGSSAALAGVDSPPRSPPLAGMRPPPKQLLHQAATPPRTRPPEPLSVVATPRYLPWPPPYSAYKRPPGSPLLRHGCHQARSSELPLPRPAREHGAPAFTATKPNAAAAPCPPSCGAKDDAVEATALAVVTDSRAPPR